ncbi:glutathione gamma-glutamylcysteinyltransferase [Methylosinus trichosporium OB3b]|uniref:glutathione gamma-glutamylcysteinyltransferase n=2 Tax=Methylocystaceae TaxID=31993 RepID=A0A2D2D5E6_METT3|nr:glutathione gamma-glutamylcysteinyltransferase [Methylosinus trichosporium OB3b]OBS54302.1 glutathione gamma-glutamylcysteinyltransferase [Methylosinus sp. 3S-1]
MTIPRRSFVALLARVAFTLALAVSAARAERLPLAENLVDLRSAQGREWLLEADAREAYWPLAAEFVSQTNGAFCGVATLVMVLNSLEVAAAGVDAASFTQENVFSDRTEAIVRRDSILQRGMTLDELGALFASFGLSARAVHAAASSLEEFRALAVDHLSRKRRHVVVNYLRSALGQQRGGHISPLAAYDGKTDRFLVLDVARYKYPPVWIAAAELYAAMNTIDAGNDGRSRGFVLVGGEALGSSE